MNSLICRSSFNRRRSCRIDSRRGGKLIRLKQIPAAYVKCRWDTYAGNQDFLQMGRFQKVANYRRAKYTTRMPSILMVESDAELASAFKQAVSVKGIQMLYTDDGNEALNLAREKHPAAIVLCVELAKGSGYSVCNKLKRDLDLAQIPLVITSSLATEETFEQHKRLKTHADAYFKKPYEEAQLLRVVHGFVQSGQKHDKKTEAVLFGELDADPVKSHQGKNFGGRTKFEIPATPALSEFSEIESLLYDETPAKPQSVKTKTEKATVAALDGLQRDDARAQEIQRLRKELDDARKLSREKDEQLRQIQHEHKKMLAETTKGQRDKDELERLHKLHEQQKHEFEQKIKILKEERNDLKERVMTLEKDHSHVNDSIAHDRKSFEKAKKAVDIALQLLEQSGYVN